jgi:inner membrane protein
MVRLGTPPMDNLTHTVTGLLLSRIGFKRWTPLATPILLLAANAPDADFVSAAGGSLNYLHFHRHLTHSLIAMPLMALIPVALVRLIGRKPVRWLGAWAIAVIAVASHLLLDLTNSYGIRLLLPFSSRWLRLDITNIVDVWIWSALFLSIAAPFLARLVGSEIGGGSGKPARHGRGAAWCALAFLLLYNCGRAVLHARAVAIVESRIYEGEAPLRVAALPNATNPWHWRAIIETSDFYAAQDVDLGAEYDPTHAAIFHKPDPDPAIEAARRDRTFSEFLEFSQYPLWRVSPAPEPENAKTVEVVDMRFGTPLAPGFMTGAIVNSRLHVIHTFYSFGRLWPR